MTYEYDCGKCHHRFDVVKSHKDIDVVEHCTRCGDIAARWFVPSRVYFSGTSVQHAEYNPGLGQVVRDKYHRSEICKAKGVEEIGSEPVASIHKYYDQKREEKMTQAYEEVDRGWVGDGSS